MTFPKLTYGTPLTGHNTPEVSCCCFFAASSVHTLPRSCLFDLREGYQGGPAVRPFTLLALSYSWDILLFCKSSRFRLLCKAAATASLCCFSAGSLNEGNRSVSSVECLLGCISCTADTYVLSVPFMPIALARLEWSAQAPPQCSSWERVSKLFTLNGH